MDNTSVKRILCIEDEPEMIDLIRLILSRRGFEVQGAAGGVEGIKLVREMLPDLVLLDLMMPDMDGWEVYQQMKADDAMRNIPVIVVTAKAQNIDKVLGLHIAKVDSLFRRHNCQRLRLRLRQKPPEVLGHRVHHGGTAGDRERVPGRRVQRLLAVLGKRSAGQAHLLGNRQDHRVRVRRQRCSSDLL